MSSTSEQASGYDRDPRQVGASTAYDSYAANDYTGALTALADSDPGLARRGSDSA